MRRSRCQGQARVAGLRKIKRTDWNRRLPHSLPLFILLRALTHAPHGLAALARKQLKTGRLQKLGSRGEPVTRACPRWPRLLTFRFKSRDLLRDSLPHLEDPRQHRNHNPLGEENSLPFSFSSSERNQARCSNGQAVGPACPFLQLSTRRLIMTAKATLITHCGAEPIDFSHLVSHPNPTGDGELEAGEAQPLRRGTTRQPRPAGHARPTAPSTPSPINGNATLWHPDVRRRRGLRAQSGLPSQQ